VIVCGALLACTTAPLHHHIAVVFAVARCNTRATGGRQAAVRSPQIVVRTFPSSFGIISALCSAFFRTLFYSCTFFSVFFGSYGADCYNFCVCAAFKLKRRTFLAIFLPFLRIFSGTLRVERKEDIFMGCVWGFLENDFLTYFKK